MSVNWFCKFYLCCGGMKEKVDLQWIGGFFVSMALTSGFCFSAILQHILKSYEEQHFNCGMCSRWWILIIRCVF